MSKGNLKEIYKELEIISEKLKVSKFHYFYYHLRLILLSL